MGSAEAHFPTDHPAAAGHFPGDPIVPGAALLAAVLEAIAAGEGRAPAPGALASARFLTPVRPGERMRIEWRADGAGAWRFSCSVGGAARVVLRGAVRLP